MTFTYKEIIGILLAFFATSMSGLLAIVWAMLQKRIDNTKSDCDQTRIEVDNLRGWTVDVIQNLRNEFSTTITDVRRNLRHDVRDINNGMLEIMRESAAKTDKNGEK